MNKSLTRSAVGCAIACGAVVVGPSIAGIAVANAGLGLGGPDINVLGIDVLGNGQKSRASAGRQAVPAVSTAPSARSVVVRAKPEPADAEPETIPASFSAAQEAPAAALGAPLAESVPSGPVPAAPQLPAAAPSFMPPAATVVVVPPPAAMPIPSTILPGPGVGVVPSEKLPSAEIPDSFRVGYSQYLRAATTGDLLVAALPGVAGIAGFTLIGAFAGYRQARAVQAALLAPVPTSVLL